MSSSKKFKGLIGVSVSICSAICVSQVSYADETWRCGNVEFSLIVDGKELKLMVSLIDASKGAGISSEDWKKHFEKYSDISELYVNDGITFIGSGAFKSLTYLRKVSLPNSLSCIGDFAFAGCYALREIEIPTYVCSIGRYAFMSCGQLRSVIITDRIFTIDEGAFRNCVSLETCEFRNMPCDDNFTGNPYSSVSESAFNNCTSLKKIVVPYGKSISIQDNAFNGCNELFRKYEGKVLTGTIERAD